MTEREKSLLIVAIVFLCLLAMESVADHHWDEYEDRDRGDYWDEHGQIVHPHAQDQYYHQQLRDGCHVELCEDDDLDDALRRSRRAIEEGETRYQEERYGD